MLLLREEVYTIIGAAMAVHTELGPGFLEAVFQEALEIECQSRQIPFESQKPLHIYYRGSLLSKSYVADMICYGTVIVELKAMESLTSREQAQLLNYLKATGLRVGLLINFGSVSKLEWQRLAK
ncbi:MAG: GxxExxY protein [Caldilineaceae bacterium]|nr:GxxExxY protein [Caldilineaceae bacterium]